MTLRHPAVTNPEPTDEELWRGWMRPFRWRAVLK